MNCSAEGNQVLCTAEGNSTYPNYPNSNEDVRTTSGQPIRNSENHIFTYGDLDL